MHFRILKMTATSGFLTTLECTEFVFGRWETLQRSPSSPSWFPWGVKEGKEKEEVKGGERIVLTPYLYFVRTVLMSS